MTINDLSEEQKTMFHEICEGLSQQQKTLPCKYFYDEKGSHLFNAICETEEYYLTRTELSIMRQFASDMGSKIGSNPLLIEYGSGNGEKIHLLLDHLIEPVAYVPVDISQEYLDQTRNMLHQDYPDLEILPVLADFTKGFQLPKPQKQPKRKVLYFPGSTIGNFNPKEATQLFNEMKQLLSSGDKLLIGVDLKKDQRIFNAAYNDSKGVTKQFNLNLLSRINHVFQAQFDLEQFEHKAFYSEEKGCVEMHLVSKQDQEISVLDKTFSFKSEETIHTESSHKYSQQEFEVLANQAGFTPDQVWQDANNYFAVFLFTLT